MKNLTILALILISIATWAQTPIPVDCDILINMDPIDINKDPIIKPAELLYDIIEVEGETEPEEEEQELLRAVYWIHGLGGDGLSWKQAANASMFSSYNTDEFKARYIWSYRPDYNEVVDGKLIDAGMLILNDYLKTNTDYLLPEFESDRGRNFIIAHSQGGLVTRAIMHASIVETGLSPHSRGYGGVVTVASSLQGAMILNNQDQILQFAADACEKITTAELETLGIVPVVDFANVILSLLGKTHTIVENACNITSYSLLPILFSNRLSPITEDYHVGAPALDVYNEDITDPDYLNMPKVAFYGIEPMENIFWRTMNWMVNDPNDKEAWEANEDYNFYYTTIQPKVLEYKWEYEHYKFLYDDYYTPHWLFPIGSSIARRKYLAYEGAYDFLCEANQGWMSITGAFEFEWNGNPFNPEFTVTLKESDGVVLQESAMNLPGQTHPPVKLQGEFEDGEWTGSTHMQIRNDAALRDALNNLYNGEYGWFFYTKEKE